MSTITPTATLLFSHGEIVKHKLRYFAVFATPVGRIQATLTKEDPKQSGTKDTYCHADLFDRNLATSDRGGLWHYVAALGYNEIESRDLSLGGALTDDKLDLLMRDAEAIVSRALVILGVEDVL
jgi:hypothetical protein